MKKYPFKIQFLLNAQVHWVDVLGYRLYKLRPPYRFIIHRPYDIPTRGQARDGWVVSEETTGLLVVRGYTTMEETVFRAKKSLEKYTDAELGTQIASRLFDIKGAGK